MIVMFCVYKYIACLVFVMESLFIVTPLLRSVFLLVIVLVLLFGLINWILTPAWMTMILDYPI